MTLKYLIVIEKASDNYSAYAPDLPGCIATGNTREEAEANMHEAMEMHIQGLIEDHSSIPSPQATADYFEMKSPPDYVQS